MRVRAPSTPASPRSRPRPPSTSATASHTRPQDGARSSVRSTAPANGLLALTVQHGDRTALRAMLGQSVSQSSPTAATPSFSSRRRASPASCSRETSRWATRLDPRPRHGRRVARRHRGQNCGPGRSSREPDRSARRPLPLPRPAHGTTSGSVTLTVHGGDHAATRLLIGQSGGGRSRWARTLSICSGRGRCRRSSHSASSRSATTSSCASAPQARQPRPGRATAAVHVGDREPADRWSQPAASSGRSLEGRPVTAVVTTTCTGRSIAAVSLARRRRCFSRKIRNHGPTDGGAK